MPIEIGGHYEVTVQAKCNGEDCNNTLHYVCGAGVDTLANFLTTFRALWRAQILPLVSDQYIVQDYVCRQFGAVIWKSAVIPMVIPPSWPNVKPLIRYSDNALLAGAGAADTGSITTAELPSMIAVGAYKACGVVTEVDFTTLPYSKLLKGFIRFGGVPEASTDDADGNNLNAAAEAAWQAAADALRYITPSGQNFTMEVWSLFEGGVARVKAGAPLMARANVTSLSVREVLTSQKSRMPGRGQ